jgi:hypothetical protein
VRKCSLCHGTDHDKRNCALLGPGPVDHAVLEIAELREKEDALVAEIDQYIAMRDEIDDRIAQDKAALELTRRRIRSMREERLVIPVDGSDLTCKAQLHVEEKQ